MMNKESMELEDTRQVSYSEVSVTKEQPTDGTLDLSWKCRTGEKLMMNEEIWKSYKTCKNSFEVSNFGNVRGAEVTIVNGRRYVVGEPVFKLVWKLFVGEKPKGYAIHRIDNNKLNDRLDNLKLMTKSEHFREFRKGRHHSEEAKKKMSEAKKGNQNAKGHKCLTTNIGKHWFNNGIINCVDFECPEGFVPGRIKKENNENL